jgi:hypothetical protein
LDKETFRSDQVSDLGILSKLKLDLEKLKIPEPANLVTEEPIKMVIIESKPVETLDEKVAETKEVVSTSTTTTTTATTTITSTTTTQPEMSTTEELVNLDLDSFDHSEEETETKVDLEKPEVRSSDDDEASFFQDNCGRLGGSAVLQAFGRAAHNLLPGIFQMREK